MEQGTAFRCSTPKFATPEPHCTLPRKTFPIHKLFERACEPGLLELTADKISQIFGLRLTKRLQAELQTLQSG